MDVHHEVYPCIRDDAPPERIDLRASATPNSESRYQYRRSRECARAHLDVEHSAVSVVISEDRADDITLNRADCEPFAAADEHVDTAVGREHDRLLRVLDLGEKKLPPPRHIA